MFTTTLKKSNFVPNEQIQSTKIKQDHSQWKAYRFGSGFHYRMFMDHEKTSIRGPEVIQALKNLQEKLMAFATIQDYGEYMEANRLGTETLHKLYFNSTWLSGDQAKSLTDWVLLRARHELLLQNKIEAFEHVPSMDLFSQISRQNWKRDRIDAWGDCYSPLAETGNFARMWLWSGFDHTPSNIKIYSQEIKSALDKIGRAQMPKYFRKDIVFQKAIRLAKKDFVKAQDENAESNYRIAMMNSACANMLKAFDLLENYILWEEIVQKNSSKKSHKQNLSLSELMDIFKKAELVLKTEKYEEAVKTFEELYNSTEPHLREKIQDFIKLSFYFAEREYLAIPKKI